MTFVGSDFVSFDSEGYTFCEGAAHGQSTRSLQVVSATALARGNPEPLRISEVLGEGSVRAYRRALEQFASGLEAHERDELDLVVDERQWGIVRGEGRWLVHGRLLYNVGYRRGEVVDFELPVTLPKTFVNQLQPPWETIRDALPGAVDAFSSPNRDMVVVVLERALQVYRVNRDQLAAAPSLTVPLTSGERPVLIQWALGKHVSRWTRELRAALPLAERGAALRPPPELKVDAASTAPVVLARHSARGVVTSIDEGDYRYVQLRLSDGQELTLMVGADLGEPASRWVGKEVEAEYTEQRMTLPEVGSASVVLLLTGLRADVSNEEGTVAYVTVSTGNIRARPDAKASIVGKLRIGTACRILSRNGEWLLVACDDGRTRGFCKDEVLSSEPPTVDGILSQTAQAADAGVLFNLYVRALTLSPDRRDLVSQARQAFFEAQFEILTEIRANPKRRVPRHLAPGCSSAASDDQCLREALGVGNEAVVSRNGTSFDVVELREGGIRAHEYMGSISSTPEGDELLVENESTYPEPPEAFSIIFSAQK